MWSEHRDALYRFACWVMQDAAVAEDVVQECFLAILAKPDRFDPLRGSLRIFLLGVARNQCRTRWRKASKEVEMVEESAAYDPHILDGLAEREAAAILNEALAKLPPLQREALYLFEYEGLSLQETAGIGRVPVGTIKARLRRGREGLKRQLGWLVKEESK